MMYIGEHSSSICYNSAGIASNDADIGSNTANITANVTDILINTVGIASNNVELANMISVVGTNSGDILTNNTDILTNPADILTNPADILTNTTDILTNTADIFHEKKNTFNCKHCNSSFAEKGQLRKHIASINAQRIETRKMQGLWKTNSGDISTNTSGMTSNNVDLTIPTSAVETNVDDKECDIKMTIKVTTMEIKLKNNLRNILKTKGKFGKVKSVNSDTREKFDKDIENTMALFKSRRFVYPVTHQKKLKRPTK